SKGKVSLKRPQWHRRTNWISSEESRAEVQRMCHASDSLLTGIGTIRADDPLLTDRSGLPRRRPLLRVVLDARLNLSLHSRIVQTADDDLLVITSSNPNRRRMRELESRGVQVAPARRRGAMVELDAALAELGKREVLNVLLEAGPTLNGSALSAGIVHKLF